MTIQVLNVVTGTAEMYIQRFLIKEEK